MSQPETIARTASGAKLDQGGMGVLYPAVLCPATRAFVNNRAY